MGKIELYKYILVAMYNGEYVLAKIHYWNYPLGNVEAVVFIGIHS